MHSARASAQAADFTFVGAGGGNISQGSNWAGGAGPGNGEDIFFSVDTGRLNVNFNYGSNKSWNSITFSRDTNFEIRYVSNVGILGTDAGGITATASGSTLRTYSILDEYRLDANQTWTTSNEFSQLVVTQAVGNLALGSNNLTLDTFNNANSTITIGSAISGTGSITKTGGGTAYLTGTNTYTGDTTVSAGTLSLSNPIPDQTNIIVASGAVLDLGFTGSITPASLTLSGILATSGTYDNTNSQITGSGTIIVSSDLTWNGSNSSTWLTGDALNWTDDASNLAGTFATGSNTTFGDTGAGIVTISGTVLPGSVTVNSAASYTFEDGAIGGSGTLTKSGSSILTLTGANTYSGTTSINDGTLVAGVADVAATSGALGNGGNIDFGGGTLQYATGVTQDYSSRVVSSASAISVDTNGEEVLWDTALANTNLGGLTKDGSGLLRIVADQRLRWGNNNQWRNASDPECWRHSGLAPGSNIHQQRVDLGVHRYSPNHLAKRRRHHHL